jgi:hypothetical protein
MWPIQQKDSKTLLGKGRIQKTYYLQVLSTLKTGIQESLEVKKKQWRYRTIVIHIIEVLWILIINKFKSIIIILFLKWKHLNKFKRLQENAQLFTMMHKNNSFFVSMN